MTGSVVTEDERSGVLREVADLAGDVGTSLSDVAGRVQDVSGRISKDAEAFSHLVGLSAEMGGSAAGIVDATATTRAVIAGTRTEIMVSRERLQLSLADIHSLVNTVSSFEHKVQGVRQAIMQVSTAADEITRIARHTRMLSGNAAIEAAQAGEAGQRFAEVAAEIKSLSGKTSRATEEIDDILDLLKKQAKVLISSCVAGAARAKSVQEGTDAIRAILDTAAEAVDTLQRQTGSISHSATEIQAEGRRVEATLAGMAEGVVMSNRNLGNARDQLDRLLQIAGSLIGSSADLGVETVHTPYIRAAQEGAAAISALFEEALENGQILESDLFDENYQPIVGSNPQQYLAAFTRFAERVLPSIQEPPLERLGGIVLCVAVDRNGYAPSHNERFSHAQGPDVAWNAANCRNRRLYNDSTGLLAARSRDPFLVQAYRRDLGGGEFVLLKDASAPIVLRGKHWGALRVAYR